MESFLDRIMYSRSLFLMTADGSFLVRKIEGFSFGILEMLLCSVCFRVIRTLVSQFLRPSVRSD